MHAASVSQTSFITNRNIKCACAADCTDSCLRLHVRLAACPAKCLTWLYWQLPQTTRASCSMSCQMPHLIVLTVASDYTCVLQHVLPNASPDCTDSSLRLHVRLAACPAKCLTWLYWQLPQTTRASCSMSCQMPHLIVLTVASDYTCVLQHVLPNASPDCTDSCLRLHVRLAACPAKCLTWLYWQFPQTTRASCSMSCQMPHLIVLTVPSDYTCVLQHVLPNASPDCTDSSLRLHVRLAACPAKCLTCAVSQGVTRCSPLSCESGYAVRSSDGLCYGNRRDASYDDYMHSSMLIWYVCELCTDRIPCIDLDKYVTQA